MQPGNVRFLTLCSALKFPVFGPTRQKCSRFFHVVAAPVTIGVDRYFVGSVLISPKSGRRFYTHELMVERESRDAPFKTGSSEDQGLSGGTHPGSIKSLLYRIAGVNTREESVKTLLKCPLRSCREGVLLTGSLFMFDLFDTEPFASGSDNVQ